MISLNLTQNKVNLLKKNLLNDFLMLLKSGMKLLLRLAERPSVFFTEEMVWDPGFLCKEKKMCLDKYYHRSYLIPPIQLPMNL